MTDPNSHEVKKTSQASEAPEREEEKKLLVKKMERWIENELIPTFMYPEIDELLIKGFVRNYGKKYEYAKLIQSEVNKIIPRGKPKKYTDVIKIKIAEEYRMLKESRTNWNQEQCLEYLADKYGLNGLNASKKVEELVTAGRKLTPS